MATPTYPPIPWGTWLGMFRLWTLLGMFRPWPSVGIVRPWTGLDMFRPWILSGMFRPWNWLSMVTQAMDLVGYVRPWIC